MGSFVSLVEGHPVVVSIFTVILSCILSCCCAVATSEHNRKKDRINNIKDRKRERINNIKERKKERINNIKDRVLELLADLDTCTNKLLNSKGDINEVYGILNRINAEFKKNKRFSSAKIFFLDNFFNDYYFYLTDNNVRDNFQNKTIGELKALIKELEGIIK